MMNPDEYPVWDPGDGTAWFFAPEIDLWTGWVPGEDGHWAFSDEEFRVMYPKAPKEDA